MKFFTVLGALALSVSTSALASSYYFETRYPAYFHFDSVAFGKPVREVMVHAAIQQVYSAGGVPDSRTWRNIQDIPMAATAQGFFAKTLFKGDDSGNSGSWSRGEGIIVQYWVTFQDGSKMITAPHLHRADGVRSCRNEYRKALDTYLVTSSTRASGAEKYGIDHPDCLADEAAVLGSGQ